MTGKGDPTERVVITGMGCVSPLGMDLESTWRAALEGRSGCGPITQFDASELLTQIAAQVDGEVEFDDIPKKDSRRMDRVVKMALAASREALADANLVVGPEESERAGVAIGTGVGGLGAILSNHDLLMKSGYRRVSPFTIPMGITNMPAGIVSIYNGLRGPNLCHVTACATGSHSIGEATRLIQRGDADIMLAGGVEGAILPITVAGFGSMRALSTRNDDPERASRPFDKDRDGFVLGEGSGVLVLESLSHAQARGARVRAEVLGYGASADAGQMVAPEENGDGAVRCMNLAIESAGLAPADIQYVNAHATSTPTGDIPEVRALRRVFGSAIDGIPVSATKSMTGHLLGAAGAVEAILTICSLETGRLLPTINLDELDPECELDHVANKVREQRANVAISNSFGFGGTNASVVLLVDS